MDEQLKQKLVTYMDSMEEAIKTGSDFVAEQAPLVVQEYLNWCFWDAVAYVCLCLFLVAANWFAFARFCSYCESAKHRELPPESREADLSMGAGWMIVGSVASIGLLIAVWQNAAIALQITIAPRVFLLERIAELVK